MKDKRRHRRVALRTTVKYGLERPPTHTSFVKDLSESGVHIQASRIFKPGTKLYLTVFFNDSSSDVEGIVTWAQKAPPGMISVAKSGMGIEFTSISKELFDFCKEKS